MAKKIRELSGEESADCRHLDHTVFSEDRDQQLLQWIHRYSPADARRSYRTAIPALAQRRAREAHMRCGGSEDLRERYLVVHS